MNDNKNYFNSPYNHRYYPSDIQPRRNSYQIAINTSNQDPLQFLSSNSSSISSINEHINTTRSLYTIHNTCSYCTNDHIQRSISQPAVRPPPDSDFLLENATFLLDSPVHALRPAHHKSRRILSPRNSLIPDESLNENHEDANSTTTTTTPPVPSLYRIIILRSFASVFALASLFSVEVLQTSIYSKEHSFQSLLTLHLSSSIGAFILAAHISHIQRTRQHSTISNVLAYDRCSQILIILATMLTSSWVMIQYFYSFYHLVLITASISGISLSCMIIKTFDHFLQLSSSLPIENMKLLTIRFDIFIFIYNSLCHLALTIGGCVLLVILLFEQWKYEYVLIGSETCLLIPCKQDDNDQLSTSMPRFIQINLTENKQVWINEPTRYLFFIPLLILAIISLMIQAGTKWTTSVMSMSRRLTILSYSNDETVNEQSKVIIYRHYLFALFIGFQEGYLFGSIIKFDVTCIYGLRCTIEMLIIYGLGATISSIIMAFVLRHISMMTSVSFTTLLHLLTIILLYLSRTQNGIYNIQPLTIKYILFFSYGIVLGLWSTIAIYLICNSTKFSSSSTFAQSLAFRYIGRIIAYTCTTLLCQVFLFYINTVCLLCIFSFIFLCYCCCDQ